MMFYSGTDIESHEISLLRLKNVVHDDTGNVTTHVTSHTKLKYIDFKFFFLLKTKIGSLEMKFISSFVILSRVG